MGSISVTSSATAYNTTSDVRLKENIASTTTGLSTLLDLRVRDYNFINNPDKTLQGFIAQELHSVYPDAVFVGGDDPSVDPWAVDYGRLTPLIVQSIQELNFKLEDLATTTVFAEPDNESFTKKFFSALIAWFADTTNGIGTMVASVFQASDMICVDDECLTADDIRQLKDKNNITPSAVDADEKNDDVDTGDGNETTPPVVLGCTDEGAVNYNQDATEDDETCEYEEEGAGESIEEEDEVNDGVGDGASPPTPILGCTDEDAENYNAEATEENDSCTYPPEPEPEVTEPETPPSAEEIEEVEEVPAA